MAPSGRKNVAALRCNFCFKLWSNSGD